MPIINLRKYYYPTIRKDAFVEVSGEVAEALEEGIRIEQRQEKKKLYHKVFSMDTNDWTQLHISVSDAPGLGRGQMGKGFGHTGEVALLLGVILRLEKHVLRRLGIDGNVKLCPVVGVHGKDIAAAEGLLPCQYTPEDLACQQETLDEIFSVLDTCTPTQREQFLLFAMDGYSYAEIGKMQGCSKEAARLSIDSVRKKFLTPVNFDGDLHRVVLLFRFGFCEI